MYWCVGMMQVIGQQRAINATHNNSELAVDSDEDAGEPLVLGDNQSTRSSTATSSTTR